MLIDICFSKYRTLSKSISPIIICIENKEDKENEKLISLIKQLCYKYDDVLCYKISWIDYRETNMVVGTLGYQKVKFYKDKGFWYEKSAETEKDLTKDFENILKLYTKRQYYSSFRKIIDSRNSKVIDLRYEKVNSANKKYTKIYNIKNRTVNKLIESFNPYFTPNRPRVKLVYTQNTITSLDRKFDCYKTVINNSNIKLPNSFSENKTSNYQINKSSQELKAENGDSLTTTINDKNYIRKSDANHLAPFKKSETNTRNIISKSNLSMHLKTFPTYTTKTLKISSSEFFIKNFIKNKLFKRNYVNLILKKKILERQSLKNNN